MTLGEVKNRILKVLREYSRRGEITPTTDKQYLDLTLSMNSLIDMHQRKIATSVKKLETSKVFTQYNPSNILTYSKSLFDIIHVTKNDVIISGYGIAHSYYFESDNYFYASIETSDDGETWVNQSYVSAAGFTSGIMKAYSGECFSTNYIRIVFYGNASAYNIRNIAMFEEISYNITNLPKYKDPMPYTLPDNFYKMKSIILNGQEQDSKKYIKSTNWEQEGTTIYLPYDEIGEYRILYWKYPTIIDDSTNDSTALESDLEAIDAIIYGVAMDIAEVDETFQPMYTRLQNKYSEIMSKLSNDVPIGRSSITQSLFSSYTSNKLF